MNKVTIIGAGMAGAIAAHTLHNAGLEVTVLEKSRGAGGRMATKRMEGTRADHGAQYFSAKSSKFQSQVSDWAHKGIIKAWKRDSGDKYDRFFAVDGMSTLPKLLLNEISIRPELRVSNWAKENEKFTIYAPKKLDLESNFLICTAPSPQAQEMLLASNSDDNCIKELKQIAYDPCIAFLLKCGKSGLLEGNGSLKLLDSVFSWAMSNDFKGFASIPSYTLHSSHEFAKEYIDASIDEIRAIFLKNLPKEFRGIEIEEAIVHKWRYSISTQRNSKLFVKSSDGVYFGGDGFGIGNGNVEGAYLSGLAMAEDLLQNL